MANILIKNVHTVDLEPEQTVCLGIKDSQISFISEQIPADFTADDIIDGREKLAVPGFVNTHTHAAMVLLRSYADDMKLMDWLEQKIWPAEATLNKKDVYWGSMLAIAEMLRSGTTTFADMYFFMEDTAQAVAESGIRAVLARGLAGGDDHDGKNIAENVQLYKNWHQQAEGRITVMFGPHAPYTCSPKYLQRVLEKATELNAGIHIHLSETKGEVENCQRQFGKTPIAYMDELGIFTRPTIAAHCTFATLEEITIMKEKKVSVAHNPQSNLKLASGIAPVLPMLEAGLEVGLGTDGASSNNNLDLFEEMRLVSMLHKGVSYDPLVINAKEALEMATVRGAKALKLADLGTLTAGAKADLVLYDISKPHWYPRFNLRQTFVYAGQAADADTVIINGKLVMQNRQLLTIDEEKVKAEVSKCVKKFGA